MAFGKPYTEDQRTGHYILARVKKEKRYFKKTCYTSLIYR
jgi:hypothetical protein